MPFPGGPSSPWGRDQSCHCGNHTAWAQRGHRDGAFESLSLEGVSLPELPGGPRPTSPCPGSRRQAKRPAVTTVTEGTVTCGGCPLPVTRPGPSFRPYEPGARTQGFPRFQATNQVSAPLGLGPITHSFTHQSGVSGGSCRSWGTSGTLRRRGVHLAGVSGTRGGARKVWA